MLTLPLHIVTRHIRPQIRYGDHECTTDSFRPVSGSSTICRFRSKPPFALDGEDLHSTGHIVTRAREQVCSMGTPLYLTYRPLVSGHLRFAETSHRCVLLRRREVRAELDHPTVPHTHHLVYTRAREHERAVFIPVDCQDLRPRRGYGKRRGGGRFGECAAERGCGDESRRAQVEYLECAIGRAGRDYVGLVWGKDGLVYACRVRLKGGNRARTLWRPLQSLSSDRSWGQTVSTHQFNTSVP